MYSICCLTSSQSRCDLICSPIILLFYQALHGAWFRPRRWSLLRYLLFYYIRYLLLLSECGLLVFNVLCICVTCIHNYTWFIWCTNSKLYIIQTNCVYLILHSVPRLWLSDARGAERGQCVQQVCLYILFWVFCMELV